MARTPHTDRWAQLGAAVRLQELLDELAEIFDLFPDLKGHRNVANRSSSNRRRKKRRLSPAGRKAIRDGVRKYWARRRAEEARSAD